MRVYYSPLLKRYIDLDSITAISDATASDVTWQVRFEIHLKLHDRPIIYCREITSEEIREHRGNTIDWITEKIQAEIEVLVDKWCGRRETD